MTEAAKAKVTTLPVVTPLWVALYATFQCFCLVRGASNTAAVNVAVMAGSTATLPCCPFLREYVLWSVKKLSATTDISVNGVILSEFVNKFFLSKTTDGCYNLVVLGTVVADTGEYTCTEDNGLNKTHKVLLTVNENITMAVNIGQKASLPCRLPAAHSNTLWRFFTTSPTGGERGIDIVVNGRISLTMVDRFRCDSYETSSDRCDLVITQSQPSDAGQYACMENNGVSEQAYYLYLFVLDVTTPSPEVDTTYNNEKSQPIGSGAGLAIGISVAVTIIAVFATIIVIYCRRSRLRDRKQSTAQSRSSMVSGSNPGEEVLNTKPKVAIEVLSRAVLQLFVVLRPKTYQPDWQAYYTLCSVCRGWKDLCKKISFRRNVKGICYPFQVSAKPLKTLVKSGTGVYYSIVLRDNFFLVRRDKMVIEVYSYGVGKAFDRLYDIDIPRTSKQFKPSGFTKSDKSNCVYLGDRESRSIHCITPRGLDGAPRESMNCWLKITGANETVQSLSELSEGRVAVLVAIQNPGGKSWRGRIDIYFADAKFEMTVPVPQSIDNPWSFTPADRNTFALTYGNLEFGLVRLDADGNILAIRKEDILSPRSIRFDPNTSSLFVALPGKRRIQRFNMKLEPVSIVYEGSSAAGGSKEDVQPMGMQLLRDGEILYMLVGMESGRVTLFQL